VQYLAEQLALEGDKAAVICFGVENRPIYESIKNVGVYRLPRLGQNANLRGFIKEVLDKERPDVVHTNWLGGFDLGELSSIAEKRSFRLVHTLHEYAFICRNGTMFKNRRDCDSVCSECAEIPPDVTSFLSCIDALVSVSGYLLRAHEKRGILGHISTREVIYNSYRPPDTCIEKRDPGEEELSIGFLGRVVYEKGIEQLLETISSSQQKSKMKLLVAGHCEPQYRQYLKSRDPDVSVQFLGFLPPQELFVQIDVLAVPSIWQEPFGRIIIEAYAHGIPVIASNRGGIPEIVKENITGLLFDPDVVGELCIGLERLAGDKGMLRSMGENAVSASKAFGPHVILEKHRRMYLDQ